MVGASQGGFITIEIAHLMHNDEIGYVVLGVCNEYNIKYYKNIRRQLCGNFLSIFESSDNKKVAENCWAILIAKVVFVR
ncbi:hypothetical protein LWM68_06965 [Niabella sp. W65]|nr:hypothetical protein [Niabella sp. W65]MCH7362534.1 hypothetical protein [Niabella sp. W65]